MTEPVYTISEVADKAKVSRSTVCRWIHSGRMRSFKVGGTRRIPESAIAEFFASGAEGGDAA